MGERMAQLKEEKRHKGERKKGSEIPRGREKPFRLGYSEADNHPLDEANAHNEWVLLQQPSSYPLFFFLSLLRRRRRRRRRRKKEREMGNKKNVGERRDDWRWEEPSRDAQDDRWNPVVLLAKVKREKSEERK
jgi:hypothetical protein